MLNFAPIVSSIFADILAAVGKIDQGFDGSPSCHLNLQLAIFVCLGIVVDFPECEKHYEIVWYAIAMTGGILYLSVCLSL